MSKQDVIEYNGLFICKTNYGYVVKDDVSSSYNLHHGMFDSVNQAKAHIEASAKRKQDNKDVKELHERLTTLEQLLQNIIAAHCGHYADVDRVTALHRAITEADEFLNV